jgi:GNAT superfamily N-acetyltransferase
VGETRVTDAAGLAAALPDIARWIETRAMLQSSHASVSGTPSAGAFVVRVVHGAISALAVVGRPSAGAIISGLDGITPLTPLVAQADNADYIEQILLAPPLDADGWQRERVIAHQVGEPAHVAPLDSRATIRLVTRDDSLGHLPAGLRHEITHAREMAPLGGVFIDDRPVSFCYPCWTTESLWDVSIDTLADYRGRGFALHAAQFMISRLAREGRAPVWAAAESNAPSLRLARRLGFHPVDENVVFSRGAWTFLSGGYRE